MGGLKGKLAKRKKSGGLFCMQTRNYREMHFGQLDDDDDRWMAVCLSEAFTFISCLTREEAEQQDHYDRLSANTNGPSVVGRRAGPPPLHCLNRIPITRRRSWLVH